MEFQSGISLHLSFSLGFSLCLWVSASTLVKNTIYPSFLLQTTHNKTSEKYVSQTAKYFKCSSRITKQFYSAGRRLIILTFCHFFIFFFLLSVFVGNDGKEDTTFLPILKALAVVLVVDICGVTFFSFFKNERSFKCKTITSIFYCLLRPVTETK